MDIKVTGSNIAKKDTFIEEMTEADVGVDDTKIESIDDYSSLNIHLNYTFGNDHAIYIGGGHVWKKKYLKYKHQTGANTTYWYESEIKSEINAMLGYVYRLTLHDDIDLARDLIIMIGYDLMPAGVHVGIGLNIF
ncbi:MAG: hypothetical protein P9L91_04150, partial [Candidatus Zophobacter franzmannii]|nr:hypothetical protein [Candidatus Zophobacter franzmannii]